MGLRDARRRGRGGACDENVGQYAAALSFGGGPQVFYYDDDATVLRHAWWSGVAWGFETLDGSGVTAGRVNESVGSDVVAMVYQGVPHVWYYDIDGGNLRHAWWTGAYWGFETLDGTSTVNGRVNGDVGMYNSALIWGGVPHVFSRDETHQDFRHAWWTGTRWAFETLDGSAATALSHADGNAGLDGSVLVYGRRPAHVLLRRRWRRPAPRLVRIAAADDTVASA